jgi:hypothetical protein
MASITITVDNTEVYLEGRLDLLAQFAGATQEQAYESVYDVANETFSVEGVTAEDLQNAYDNFPALHTQWKTTNGFGPIALEDYKARAKNIIDQYAGATRLKFITSVPGQEMTYQEKAEEATDYVAAGYPADLSGYPFVAAEATATGATATEVADAIIAQRSAWVVIGAEIEQYRIGGKFQVENAESQTEVDGIVNSTKLMLDSVGT